MQSGGCHNKDILPSSEHLRQCGRFGENVRNRIKVKAQIISEQGEAPRIFLTPGFPLFFHFRINSIRSISRFVFLPMDFNIRFPPSQTLYLYCAFFFYLETHPIGRFIQNRRRTQFFTAYLPKRQTQKRDVTWKQKTVARLSPTTLILHDNLDKQYRRERLDINGHAVIKKRKTLLKKWKMKPDHRSAGVYVVVWWSIDTSTNHSFLANRPHTDTHVWLRSQTHCFLFF